MRDQKKKKMTAQWKFQLLIVNLKTWVPKWHESFKVYIQVLRLEPPIIAPKLEEVKQTFKILINNNWQNSYQIFPIVFYWRFNFSILAR